MGRIAAAAINDTPALVAIKKKPLKILGTFGMPDEVFGYALRKDDKDFLDKLNEGLRRLVKTNCRAELKRAYIERR